MQLLCLSDSLGTFRLTPQAQCFSYGWLNPRLSYGSPTQGRPACWRGGRMELMPGKAACGSPTISNVTVPVWYEVMCDFGNLSIYRSYPSCDNTQIVGGYLSAGFPDGGTGYTLGTFTPSLPGTAGAVNTFTGTQVWTIYNPNPGLNPGWCSQDRAFLIDTINIGPVNPNSASHLICTACEDLPLKQHTTTTRVKGINAGVSAALYWDTFPPTPGKTLSVPWNVYTQVAKEADLKWDVRAPVGVEVGLLWDDFVPAAVDSTLLWDANGTVGVDLNSFWDVLMLVNRDLDVPWHVRVLAPKQASLLWDVRHTAGQEVSLDWNTYVSAGKTFSCKWHVRQLATRDAELIWHVFKKIGKTVQLRWHTFEITQFKPRDQVTMAAARATLDDLMARRGAPGGGFSPYRFLELDGARIVEPTSIEPDPATSRVEYYYNAVQNQLYRRVYDRYEPEKGIVTAHWRRAGEPTEEAVD